MTNNPLAGYFRHPELYINLPSQGRWWADGSLSMPENGELPIFSMTGQDELSMKNADGLMNGDTTVRVLQSCCPNIKNAWNMPSIDLDALMIAIRISSYGHKMEASTSCSKCNETIDYAVDLRYVLSNIKTPNYDIPVEIKDLTVMLKPAPYQIVNLNNMETYQQQRAVMQLKDEKLTEQQKIDIVKSAVQRLTDISVSRLSEFIDKIMLPDGNVVTDKKFITEFINNTSRESYASLRDSLAKKAQEYQLPTIPLKCDACGHEDKRQFQFDPASFFAISS